MNVQTLISQHPMLNADLVALGLPRQTLHQVAEHISGQLGSAQGNLCYILSRLSTRDFVHAIDAGRVAEYSGVPASIAQSVVLMVAPWVGQFRLGHN